MGKKNEEVATIDIAELLKQLGIEHVHYLSWLCKEQASPLTSISMNAELSQTQ
jgi:hypothetical protein